MPLVKPPSNPGGTSLGFITVGAVLAVLCGTSYIFFAGDGVPGFIAYMRLAGLVLGVVFLVIGFGVGRIGRNAREAEKLPEENAKGTAANGEPAYTSTTNPPR